MKHERNEILSSAGSQAASQSAFKTLLLPVDARESCGRSVAVACRLAARFDSHLIGVYVRPPFYLQPEMGAFGSTIPIALIEESMEQAAQAARSVFDGATAGSDARSLEWRSCKGDPVMAVAAHARYADLVIVNQTDPDDGGSHFADRLLLSVNRPVLVVPTYGDFENIGNRILVCWNASPESARAVTDALSFLKSASKVTVLSVDPRASEAGQAAQSGADLAVFLARHGVKADVVQTISGGHQEGNVILSRAADDGSDLIVMGAYGHTRIRETIFGGTTRTILQSMTVPVLMSH